MKRDRGYTLAALAVDRTSPTPLTRQVYESLRRAILKRQLHPGMRLPSTRSISVDLHVSRNTILIAFEQLIAEGYIETKTGSGTFVARTIPDELLRIRNRTTAAARRPTLRRSRTPGAATVAISEKRRAFEPALPALDLFPIELWTRLIAKQWSKDPAILDSLTYGDVAGHPRLRHAIAQYVGATRGVACEASQVIVTNGLQTGLELISRVLLDPGDAVWCEDPAFPPARAALAAAGGRIVLVPVDRDGLDVAAGLARCATPRLICVTPSHQFPLGVTMSVARRMELIDAARHSNAWILEDDYDSEYRYRTAPLPAIHGLDPDGRVIYSGTFSKVLFPALRLAYIVVPEAVVDRFMTTRAMAGRTLPSIDQLVVAEFINRGHFERHIRRMRSAYRERQDALLDSAAKYLGGLATVNPSEAGTHTLAYLQNMDDAGASRAAAEHNIQAAALSSFCAAVKLPDALVLGYGAVTPRQIRVATEVLASALARQRLTVSAARSSR